MQKDDLIILFIALLLLAGMIITIIFGGEKSRHGVGKFFYENPRIHSSLTKQTRLDLGQRPKLRGWV